MPKLEWEWLLKTWYHASTILWHEIPSERMILKHLFECFLFSQMFCLTLQELKIIRQVQKKKNSSPATGKNAVSWECVIEVNYLLKTLFLLFLIFGWGSSSSRRLLWASFSRWHLAYGLRWCEIKVSYKRNCWNEVQLLQLCNPEKSQKCKEVWAVNNGIFSFEYNGVLNKRSWSMVVARMREKVAWEKGDLSRLGTIVTLKCAFSFVPPSTCLRSDLHRLAPLLTRRKPRYWNCPFSSRSITNKERSLSLLWFYIFRIIPIYF